MKQYIWIFMLTLLVLSACNSNDNEPATPGVILPAELITFTGGGELGIFDPSITSEPGSGRLWMSYSAVDASKWYKPALYWSVSIRLAFSDDNGATWQDADVAVAAYTEPLLDNLTVTDPAPAITFPSTGIWQSETSSLIYDPGALPGEEWKLIWFQYLNANLTSYYLDYSWIALKTAATPLELASATPVKLFGGFGLQADAQITGSPVFSPTSGLPAIQLNSDLIQAATGDKHYCVFAEPGLYATDNAIYLAIFCSDVVADKEFLLYFKCPSPCQMTNPAAWQYLGLLLAPLDASSTTGHNHYQAPDIFESNDRYYLLVTPVEVTTSDTGSDNRYDGCRVYEFTDINSPKLKRDLYGDLIEIQRVDGEINTHNGACSALDNMQGGIIHSQLDINNPPEIFKIYKSNINLP